MKRILGLLFLSTSAVVGMGGAANASLVEFASFFGHYAVSTDGWGGSVQGGVISASVPSGSTVKAAYLYSSKVAHNNAAPTLVTLNGTNVGPYTSLGTNPGPSLTAHRADVTSIVKAVIDGGAGGVYNFDIFEGTETSAIDGNALVVVYENAALPEASVGILDGFSASSGDSTSINFSEGLDLASAGFFAEMSLGIGFSCCNQRSTVSVNGNLLTENAGNNDDGEVVANGSLITVGGFDDAFSPVLPSYAEDSERYDLAASGFLNQGDTTISIDTLNPSNDDNIFLATFYVRGRAGFNEPPPPPDGAIPLPASALLLMGGLGSLLLRRKKSA